METAAILSRLERATGKFPRGAVEAAVARREEITPELLRILADTVDRAYELEADSGYMAHLYALFLLAQFRETRAYPLAVRFASLPGGPLDALCGDFLTEDLGRVLASVSGGEMEGIQSVIENEDADQWARGAALSSLVTLVASGQRSRDEIVSYFADLFRGKLNRESSHVWDALVSSACDLYPQELLDDIKKAFEDELVDPAFIAPDDVEDELARGRDRVLAALAGNPHLQLVEDVVAEMQWWACFRERRTARPKRLAPAAIAPIRRAEPKTGRNEPCPCGSGKKYKKCCGG